LKEILALLLGSPNGIEGGGITDGENTE